MRKQADLLDHVPDPPPQGRDILGLDVHAVEQDLTRARLDQAVDHLECGRLAAPGRPHQDTYRTGGHLEGEIVDSPRSTDDDRTRAGPVCLRNPSEFE